MSKAPFAGSVDLPWDQAQKRLMDQMLSSLDQSGLFHTCAIARADTGHILQPLAVSGPVQQIVLENVAVLFSPDHPHARSMTARAQVEDRTLLVTDYVHSEYLQHPDLAGWRQAIEAIGIQWLLATPIHRHASVWGVLVLSGLQDEPPELMADSAEKVAEFIADAMEHLETRRNEQQYRETLKNLAHTDALTDLPNRRALETQMEQAMLHAIRHNRLLAICMLDLDDFKPINDTYGHEIGDEVLVTLGKRLTDMLRKSDFIARYGGDEFVLLLEDLAGHADLTQVLQKIEEIITTPILLSNGESVEVGASMGVVLYPFADTDQADQLLRWSDQALYEIKAHKTDRENCWVLFGAEILANRRNPAQILLDNGALEVWYQPILNSRTHKVVGVEALARLRDTEGTLWHPAKFLPQLQPGSLSDLTKKVLVQSLNDLTLLDTQGWSLSVSVNLDPQSVSAGCVTCLQEVIAQSTVDPARITLEILEGGDFFERQKAVDALLEIKALGFRLALDDVGSAYSSLLRMKDLPIDEIKLDQGFVRTLEQRPQDLHFLGAIQDLATGMKVDLVVEGVETEDVLDAVTVMGSTLLQGYAIAKPMPFEELQAFLKHSVVPHRHRPISLLGLYAARLAQHETLKKTIIRSPRAVDYLTLADATVCPIHGDIHRLGQNNVNRLDHLHREYHSAIAVMDALMLTAPSGADWSAVDQTVVDFEQAIVETYFEEKSKKQQTS
ncbi:putative bifunctional diguanylate cyclase/phosphodiesterase [Acidithiobacillus thiooxidans]|uniref:putative bifunctional diguanylate cyclase/phosphodiesterase n=1 Tax=Acidithiobacillus thiooxidans TaxID=930 RepID=UPI001F51E087|nr:EAL domain-containing protein [Acidithiobacillus thiooxidans]